MKPFADRLNRLGTETAFEVLARARALEAQGKEIIHMEIGEPDFDTPAHIKQAAKDALDAGYTHYTPAAGLTPVRQTVADYVAETRHIPVGVDNVVVVPGGKPIMFYAIMALVDPGDEVIYPNPGFPIYESMINFVGGAAVPLPLREAREFSFDLDEFKSLVTPRTKLIVINSPGNPCGGVMSRADLEGVAEMALKHDCYVLSDEIYSRILYEGEHFSIAALPGMQERTLILDGFSKTYAMTGWRLGYGVMNRELAAWTTKLMVNSNSCTSAFTQMAGMAALTGDQRPVARMVEEFRRRRDLIVAGLNEIPGIRCCMPRGAFYAFPNITGLIERGLGDSARVIADRLLNEAGVATLAGTSFGRYGEGYLRLSYATSMENIHKALARMGQMVEN
ncbi:MAG: pyridoxal phosphate-dependent aminotransferase [Anaerolineae bacterium]|nr:pyridoxal phosphate-dependent aminotransferase [Anaerolineae bacterium]